MTPRNMSRALFVAGAIATCFAGTALASQSSSGFNHIGPSPAGLPACSSTRIFEACRMPVKQGSFDALDGWTTTNHVQQGGDASGNKYAAVGGGSTIKQAVYAEYGTFTADATYALRFRVMSENGEAPVRVTLSMSDYNGTYTEKLTATTTTAHHHEWTEVEMIVDGKAFVAPAHVLVEIANEAPNATVQIDDVFLVQSVDAEAAN